jgi:formylglycine-generating enzyme required for sulfatase activity
MSAEGEPRPPLHIGGTTKSFAAQSTLVPSDQTRLQDPLQAVGTDAARLGAYCGQVWDDFEIGELIGFGGMGAVYRARQITLDRPVAIKVLGHNLSHDDSFKQRFLREARAVAQISSPNVVQIHSAGTHSGHHFFVMELIDGEDLAHLLRGGFRPTNAQAFDLILQAARGLVAAGRLGIVHRDIKPANMLLTRDRVLKITDFGLVKLVAEDGTRAPADGLTATGIIVGTAGYFSPEQGLGERCDQRTDLYALGVVAFQLLTGRLPFLAEDTTSVIYQHVHEPVPRLRTFNPTIHPELERVILGCLQKKPTSRPQSAEQLVRELEQVALTGCISSTAGRSAAWRWGLAAASLLAALLIISALSALMVHQHAVPTAPGSGSEAVADAAMPLDGEQRHQALSEVANDAAAPVREDTSATTLESENEAAIQHAPSMPATGPALPPALAAPVLAPLPSPATSAAAVEPMARQRSFAPGAVQTAPAGAMHPAADPLGAGPLLAASQNRTYAPLPERLLEPPEDRGVRTAAPAAPVVVPVVSAVDGSALGATAPPTAASAPPTATSTTEAPDDSVPAGPATAPAPAPAAAADADTPAQAAVASTMAAAPGASAPADAADAYGRYRDVRILTQTARFRWCPPCRFLMGSPPDEPHRNSDEDLHLVDLTQGYWIMDRECPQALWDAVMGYDPASNQDLACPVENISWKDVQVFIVNLNHLTPGLHARLPTEAEWECSARAGDAPTVHPQLAHSAWYADTADGHSQHGALLQANSWGLFDCLGNVSEWCADSYGPYQGPLSVDPRPHGAGAPVIRGGSFRDGAAGCRLAQRDHRRSSFRSPRLGFRLAASVLPDAAPASHR